MTHLFLFFFPTPPSFLKLVLYYSRSLHVQNVIPLLMFLCLWRMLSSRKVWYFISGRPPDVSRRPSVLVYRALLFCYVETLASRSPLPSMNFSPYPYHPSPLHTRRPPSPITLIPPLIVVCSLLSVREIQHPSFGISKPRLIVKFVFFCKEGLK